MSRVILVHWKPTEGDERARSLRVGERGAVDVEHHNTAEFAALTRREGQTERDRMKLIHIHRHARELTRCARIKLDLGVENEITGHVAKKDVADQAVFAERATLRVDPEKTGPIREAVVGRRLVENRPSATQRRGIEVLAKHDLVRAHGLRRHQSHDHCDQRRPTLHTHNDSLTRTGA